MAKRPPPTLRLTVKRLIGESDESVRQIAINAKVPMGALYYFCSQGDDMLSQHLENLYNYLTGEPLIKG